MKQTLRRFLAVCCALLLPCGLIPTAAMAAAPGTNLVTNGDFETGSYTGWEKWQSTVVDTASAHSGSYGAHIKGNGGWGGMLNQDFPIVSGHTYLLSFWFKVNSNGFNYQFKGVQTGTDYGGGWHTQTGWTLVTKTFTADGDSAVKLNFCGSGNGLAEDAYVDDVSLIEVIEPSSDGYIVNGDFETGTASPWTVYDPSSVSAAACYEGFCGAHLKGDGGGGTLMCQTVKGFTPGETYEISMWIKVNAQGVNVQIKNLNNDGAVLANDYYNTAECGTWTKVTLRFTAASNTVFLNFCGSGTGSAEDLYVDSVACAYVPPVLVSGGEMSIRDGDNGGRGLAFRFDVTAANGAISLRNAYQASSATVTVCGVVYPLVKMGAVMTNNAAVGSGEMTLQQVDGKKVIDIPAVYLCDRTADSLSYAVRILDIPDKHAATDIYARPYYVYNDNGTAVTVYGDNCHGNYAAVLGE